MTPPAPPKLAALREGLPAHRLEIVELVERLAPRFDIDPALALAVIAVESNFDARARSPRNAQGLMQLIPATAQRFKVRDAYDPAENVKGGLAYLRWLLSYYRGQVELAIAAYNAGEGAVDRHGGVPPYAETRAYVRKVLELYEAQTHPYVPRSHSLRRCCGSRRRGCKAQGMRCAAGGSAMASSSACAASSMR